MENFENTYNDYIYRNRLLNLSMAPLIYEFVK